ncbi:MAG TPA: MarR family transcriptional regulator [Acidimicrobiia bacterium]|nr:MarR family transcriptional regulator [Acidimicrobiia bacterium]
MTDADPIGAWSALVAVYQSVLHDVVGRLGDEAGIDSGVFSALAYLERSEPAHRIRLSELQRLMHPRYSQPGLSRLVQRMETDGIVERRADPDDGRAAILVTTARGRRAYERANRVYEAAVHEHFGRHLDTRDGARLEAMLGRVMTQRDAARR